MTSAIRLLALTVLFVFTAPGYSQEQDSGEMSELEYRLLGPVNGGRASRVVGIPGDPLTYYLATAAGGVWKSSNGGNNWESVFDDQPVSSIGSVAVASGNPNIVFVGSDRTAANGDVANKIGTYKLGVVARENGIPFFPVVPTSTVDLSLSTGDDIPIEERDGTEITELTLFGRPIAPKEAKVRNPAFDVTPHKYVTGIVTEHSVVYPPFKVNLRNVVTAEQAKISN